MCLGVLGHTEGRRSPYPEVESQVTVSHPQAQGGLCCLFSFSILLSETELVTKSGVYKIGQYLWPAIPLRVHQFAGLNENSPLQEEMFDYLVLS